MSNDDVNNGRRLFLVGASVATAGVGAVGVAVPFVQSWTPSARAQNAGAPVSVDVSKIEPGKNVIVEWRGQPVWIVRRTPEMVEGLASVTDELADPDSDVGQQPEYAKNEYRSIKPEYLVLLGKCTHLGCSPKYRPQPDVELEQGGFFCPCHSSKFDMAGRVYKGVPAPTNLEVPPHSYQDDTVLVIGVEGEATA